MLVIYGFTKFVKLFAVKTLESRENINCLSEYFRNYIRPQTIISSFTSQEFKNFIDENNVEHVLMAMASPKANGQVERVNRILGSF